MGLMMTSNDSSVNPAAKVVQLTGKATVAEAADLKKVLVEALETSDEVVVDVSGVTGCDPTFFQLLCAAHRSSESLEKRLKVVADDLSGLRNLSAATGFQPASGCCRGKSGCLLHMEGEK